MALKLLEEIMLERAKGVKLTVPVGAGKFGQRADPKVQDVEGEVMKALEKLGLKRGIDYIFKPAGTVRFTKAEDVTPKVKTALRKFGAK